MKPMLAGKVDLSKLRYPVLVSPKLDGIRAIVKDGQVLGRSLKPIPNKYVQSVLGKPEFNGLDGELILGDPTADDVYRKSNSAFMSHEGEPGFSFFVFDRWDMDAPYKERLHSLMKNDFIFPVLHMVVENEQSLLSAEDYYLKQGYEGLMIRRPEGKYKHGRSTTKEGILLKLKRFTDSEAVIIGFDELMHNGNEAKKNELGQTDRSSCKAGLVPMDTLGALVVRDGSTEFKIGTGFTEAQRKLFWSMRSELEGKTVKYKHFEIGVKDAPRHPVFIGFRDAVDM